MPSFCPQFQSVDRREILPTAPSKASTPCHPRSDLDLLRDPRPLSVGGAVPAPACAPSPPAQPVLFSRADHRSPAQHLPTSEIPFVIPPPSSPLHPSSLSSASPTMTSSGSSAFKTTLQFKLKGLQRALSPAPLLRSQEGSNLPVVHRPPLPGLAHAARLQIEMKCSHPQLKLGCCYRQ